MIEAALDTSVGFALAVRQDGRVLREANLPGMGRESDRLLLPWLVQELARAGLEVNAVERWSLGTGPGSFAGLRCGLALVKGIALASGALLRGVPSAIAIAAALAEPGWSSVGVLHDGRCGQVLFGRVEAAGGWHLAAPPVPLDPGDLQGPQYACDGYATLQAAQLPPLPEAVCARLRSAADLAATPLLEAGETHFPWPAPGDEEALEASTTPLYVRQAVFVRPAAVKEVK